MATSEAGIRASLYLTSLTGALVAVGFIAQVGEQFDAFAAAVLPALFLLGEFTYVRLLENSIEDGLLQRSINPALRHERDRLTERRPQTTANALAALRAWSLFEPGERNGSI